MRTSPVCFALALAVAGPLAAQSAPAPVQLNVHVFRLKNADSQQLAPALQQLMLTRAVPARSAPRPGADTLVSARTPVVVPDSTARAAAAAQRSAVGSGATASASSAQFVRILAETTTNSLVVRSTDEDWQLIMQIVQLLDR